MKFNTLEALWSAALLLAALHDRLRVARPLFLLLFLFVRHITDSRRIALTAVEKNLAMRENE